jgi:hypothetical protein
MAAKSPVKRIASALDALDAADGAMERLDVARRLRQAAEELEVSLVDAARKAGATWSDIGVCYELTKQGAQQKFRSSIKENAVRPKNGAAGKLVSERG